MRSNFESKFDEDEIEFTFIDFLYIKHCGHNARENQPIARTQMAVINHEQEQVESSAEEMSLMFATRMSRMAD